jgi:hypothetical protein
LDAELGAARQAALGGQAGMDDRVSVILAWEVVEGCLQGTQCLLESGIADRMHLDLQPRSMGSLGKPDDLLVAVEQHPLVVGVVVVGLEQRGVLRAKTTIQSGREAAADPRELAGQHLVDIQGLEKDPSLIARVLRSRDEAFEIDV